MKKLKGSPTQLVVLEDNKSQQAIAAATADAALNTARSALSHLNGNIQKFLLELAGTPKAQADITLAMKDGRVKVEVDDGFAIIVTEKEPDA